MSYVRPFGKARTRRTLTRLASYTMADTSLDAPTMHTLYTVPRRRKAIIDHIRVHSNGGSLAGMTDVNFGGGAAAITPVWKDAQDLSSMTTAHSEMKVITAGAVVIIDGDDSTVPNRSLMAQVVAGSTAATTAVFDIWGYLIDS